MSRLSAAVPKDGYYDPSEWDGAVARPSINRVFCANLNALMRKGKVSGAHIARECGLSPSAISLWRNGETEPSHADLGTIARVLNVPVWRLFYDPTDTSEIPPGSSPLALTDYVKQNIVMATEAIADLKRSFERVEKAVSDVGEAIDAPKLAEPEPEG